MTQEDRDAAIGRAFRTKTAAIRNLAELRSHAKHLGMQFSNLGAMLTDESENIWFEGNAPIKKTGSAFTQLAPFKFTDFNPREIADLAEQIRIAMDEVERVTAAAAEFGI
jgi:predicted YcjX-like family ATPase